MNSKRRECRWGDLATLEYGKGLRGYGNGIGPYTVYGTNGPIGRHTEPLCTHPGVIIGRKGAYRGVHYSDKPFYVIDTAFYLEPKIEIDLRWAYYQLLTQDINSMDSGSAIPSTSRDAFYNLPVNVPPIHEQKAIASILGALDDKIELNRKINETLEAMARAIFKSWFVDFEPIPGFGPHKEWQDSLLGKIPKGWRVGTVGELGEIVCGKTPSTRDSDNYGDEIPFITIPDMHGRVFVTTTNVKLSNKGANTQNKKWLPAKSVCVSCIATPGLVALTSKPSHTNQQINSIICRNDVSPYYCFFLMKSIREDIINAGSGGSATLNLNKGNFSKMRVLIANNKYIETFHKTTDSIFNKILLNDIQSENLSSIRDTLLPKLLSIEIRVKDAEKFVEKAKPEAVEFVRQESKPSKRKAPEEFREAILIAALVRALSSSKYPLGRIRYTKLSYLTHRKAGHKVEQKYLKKAAGPYNPLTRYKGPEKIALQNGYIKKTKRDKYEGFMVGDKVLDIDKYLNRYNLMDALNWVIKHCGKKTNDQLELLATVDLTALELQAKGKPITSKSVRDFISNETEWTPKLERKLFSEINIKRALNELKKCFPMNYTDVQHIIRSK